MRMREPRQDRAFAPEPFLGRAPEQRSIQQLDRSMAREPAVAALGEPDTAHPAVADRRHQRIRAEGQPGQRGFGRVDHGRRGQKPLRRQQVVLGQERPDVCGCQRILGDEHLEVLVTLCRRQVKQSIEMRAGTLPAVGADRAHVLPARSVDRKRRSKPDIRPASIISEHLVQVNPSFLPVALNHTLRNRHHRRNLREREPAEEFQVNDAGQGGVGDFEVVEGAAQAGQFVGVGASSAMSVDSDVISNSPPRFCAWRRRA